MADDNLAVARLVVNPRLAIRDDDDPLALKRFVEHVPEAGCGPRAAWGPRLSGGVVTSGRIVEQTAPRAGASVDGGRRLSQ
jgi:hypothetical protein